MPKRALKAAAGYEGDPAMIDTDRVVPKASGGTYERENYRLLEPVEHMKRHGNYRERAPEMEQLKAIIDDREQVRKVAQKVHNQLKAYERRVDQLNEITHEWLIAESKSLDLELAARDKMLAKAVKEFAKLETPDGLLAKAALGVRSVGPVTVAYCLVYIDLAGRFPEKHEWTDKAGKKRSEPHPRAGQEKCPHVSSAWAYAGLDKPSHERYEKGTTSGGNKSLRTVLYTMADSQQKGWGAYREVYDRTKDRLAQSEKVTKSRNTKGLLVECAWKDTKPCHRHGAALRAIMKNFLADYWVVGRELHGLSTSALYAEAMLGQGHRTVNPRERGWEW